MSKQQKLRNVADGFMAALVANGYEGPWRWRDLDWEFAFYKAWRDWPPQQRDPRSFPSFELGGHRTSSQGREMLWQLKSTSPFHAFRTGPLPTKPLGLDPIGYLEIWAKGASPAEWVALGRAFLSEMGEEEE